MKLTGNRVKGRNVHLLMQTEMSWLVPCSFSLNRFFLWGGDISGNAALQFLRRKVRFGVI